MVWRRRVWGLILAAAGCCAPAVAPRSARPPAPPVAPELPATNPTVPVLDGAGLPQVPARESLRPGGSVFRRLTEGDCLVFAAANAPVADQLDDEQRVPSGKGNCPTSADRLRQTVRYHAALELRNRAAGDALDRFVQLADAEARGDLLRQAVPVLDGLTAKAKGAKAADVRFPLDPADLDRQRSQLRAQLEQAELGSRLLDLDLKRRLGLPAQPADDRLWPVGDFAIDATPVDPERAATAALADRPELRGLWALYNGLTPDVLPDVREMLRAGSPLLGLPPAGPVRRGFLALLLGRKRGPDPAAVAELEVRKRQLLELIADRERQVADEARAAALTLNAQTVRAALARDRVAAWEKQLAEAVKKREANQPGAELQEPQVRLDWLKARGELASEVAAWHQARVRLKAAQGWLVWEALEPDTRLRPASPKSR